MNNAPFRSKFNWLATEGNVARFVSYNIQANETTDPIPQEKLLNPEACIVLEPQDQKTDYCEQTISVNPTYQILRLALLGECRRIESFVGKTSEYYQTHNGEQVADVGAELFRFDIQFEVCGTSELILRYITPTKEPLCLYGMHMALEKNSNPLGMFASDSTLNRAMIELKVKDSKLSDKAARCKQFVLDSMALNSLNAHKLFQNMMNHNIANAAFPAPSGAEPADSAQRDSARPSRLTSGGDIASSGSSATPPSSSFSELIAKQYLDAKFATLEAKVEAKLEALESRQNQKLDEIIALLKGISTK